MIEPQLRFVAKYPPASVTFHITFIKRKTRNLPLSDEKKARKRVPVPVANRRLYTVTIVTGAILPAVRSHSHARTVTVFFHRTSLKFSHVRY